MRLLQLHDGELNLTPDLTRDIPPYAILSHTWRADGEEVTFQDVSQKKLGNKPGYQKILFCGQQAKRDGLDYFWVDTCCIDKTSSAELAKAINSMFRWYQNATVCYAYLQDVSAMPEQNGQTLHPWDSQFRGSRWFTRGWTLQELLAPKSVKFFSSEGILLGNRMSLENVIHTVTKIHISALRGDPLDRFPILHRMQWSSGRYTTEEEDAAYCLLGIFDVYIVPIYGEGKANAMNRLLNAIQERTGIPSFPAQPKQSESSSSSPANQEAHFPLPSGRENEVMGKKLPLDDLVGLKSELDRRTSLLEEMTKEVSSLRELISEKDETTHNLKEMTKQSGQKDCEPSYEDIVNRILELKAAIISFCRKCLPLGVKFQSRKGSSPDMSELLMRSNVAQEIHWVFFHERNQLFGHLDNQQYREESKDRSSYQKIEGIFTKHSDSEVLGKLRKRMNYDGEVLTSNSEDEIKKWRISTINLAKRISRDQNAYPFFQARKIWPRLYERSAHFQSRSDRRDQPPETLFELCKIAYDLALLFRSSYIDYKWQQDIGLMAIQPDDAEVIGSTGVLYSAADDGYRVGCVVFGGVVRGSRSTGKIRDGPITLTRPAVVIDYVKKDERRLK
ncbi:hypothetical protein PFICI_11226 [Pestalotiopsis fici W106-1]|uniref:Heterokaryon incompatibility domain-containing protein n=1 Tax=Pestalotiopsis fici (strain W106-1 / CGMCC3.15140) TaxID=1229662 RepID=W3WW62_PESFW|nr:uncharacterized protein PFICI_11226 [Pestalotiopsis fici W106-1]ETS77352.1 hypothetical protein PFICI_11226 [Pestalotiopsis fici W106-1]